MNCTPRSWSMYSDKWHHQSSQIETVFFRTEDITKLLPFCALWSIHNCHATECDDSFPSSMRHNTVNRTESFENISSNNAPLFHNIHNNWSVESNGQVFVYVTFLFASSFDWNNHFIICGSQFFSSSCLVEDATSSTTTSSTLTAPLDLSLSSD